jgi:hypothetical protein
MSEDIHTRHQFTLNLSLLLLFRLFMEGLCAFHSPSFLFKRYFIQPCLESFLHTEMEFVDINLTKDSSLLLNDIHSPFHLRILKKTILFSGFKNKYKKIHEKENSSLFINGIL